MQISLRQSWLYLVRTAPFPRINILNKIRLKQIYLNSSMGKLLFFHPIHTQKIWQFSFLITWLGDTKETFGQHFLIFIRIIYCNLNINQFRFICTRFYIYTLCTQQLKSQFTSLRLANIQVIHVHTKLTHSTPLKSIEDHMILLQ